MSKGALQVISGFFDDVTGRFLGFRNPITLADDLLTNVVAAYTAARTLTGVNDGGKTLLWNSATGFAFTLPAATGTGDIFRFKVGVVPSSGSHSVKVANSTDIIQGSMFTVSDNSAAVLGYNAASDSDTITLNGTTTGGLTRGDWIEVQDIKSGVFSATGFTSSSGTEATPFSAAV